MNILVCIKQVPDVEAIGKNPETNEPVLQGVPEILNPYDGYALEAAARLKDDDPEVKIVVLTVGPDKDKTALKTCLSIAADKAYRVSSDNSVDALSISGILAKAIQKIEETEGKFDTIFCGQQTTDWESAQVGPELAERLSYPQITACLECETEGRGLKVSKKSENGKLIESISFPCLLTFTQPGYDPRFPTIKRKMAANKAAIPVIEEAELELDMSKMTSALETLKIYAPAKRKGGMIIAEESMEDSTVKLVSLLSEAHVI